MITERALLELSRAQILAFRRRVSSLDRRLSRDDESLRTAAWAGLQDSAPRAGLLSLHARVDDIDPFAWEDPSLVQLWGPRHSVYVVPREDRALFSLGLLPDGETQRRRAVEMADQLEAHAAGGTTDIGTVGHALGIDPNALRYAAPTGRVLIRWDGARQPAVWMVPAPDVDPMDARLELARRHLHLFGPTTAEAFAKWAGLKPPAARAAWNALEPSLIAVHTPIGARWVLADDEDALRAAVAEAAPARLLPSGDTFWLLHAADRDLLVPEPAQRDALWTPRVWPGALLVGGELVGTWRRAGAVVDVSPWRALSAAERYAVEAEAASLPLPGLQAAIAVRWDG